MSPVRQPSYQAYQGPSSGASVYSGGYVGGYYAPGTPGYVGYNAYNIPGYTSQSVAGSGAREQFSAASGPPQPFPGPGPQPYFIASASGQPFPGSLLPVTTSAGQTPAQGFLCGPYNYPYSGGRVIGPIIAIAPGSVGGSPILNIPNATATSQTQHPTQLLSRGSQEMQNKGKEDSKPQGKAMPIMSTTMSAEQALFRNILPKNRDMKHASVPSSVGGKRPMQVVGPIANHPGLVATVLPNFVTSVPNTILTSTTSTTTSVTKIVTGTSKEATNAVKRESESPVVLRHVTGAQRHREDFQPGFKSYVDGKFEKSREKLENTVRGIQIKNTTSPLLPARSLPSLPKSKSLSDIVSVPANSHGTSPSKRTADCTPIVTVTVKSKSGAVEEDHHVIKRPKDWKEIVKSQSFVSRSSSSISSMVTPLKVPKPSFQFLENEKSKLNQSSLTQSTSELPTFHFPHLSDASEPGASLGHPGLPFGLKRMTTSLMQISKSPTKMALKEMKRIPSRDIGQPLDVTAPGAADTAQLTQDEDCDLPPRLSPQISLHSPTLSRSRLQLKPATSPKLNIEQYLTVSNANISKLADSGISSIKNRKGQLVECKASPVKETKAKTPDVSISQNAEKKAKRDSLSRKQSSHGLIPWSKRSKEPPKKSGGWSWKTKGFIGKVYLNVSKNFQFFNQLEFFFSE